MEDIDLQEAGNLKHQVQDNLGNHKRQDKLVDNSAARRVNMVDRLLVVVKNMLVDQGEARLEVHSYEFQVHCWDLVCRSLGSFRSPIARFDDAYRCRMA